MFKTLSAALIAASVMFAPVVSASAAQPTTKPAATATKQVVVVKKTKRFVVRHDRRRHLARHARHFKEHGIHARYGKTAIHKRLVTKKVRARVPSMH